MRTRTLLVTALVTVLTVGGAAGPALAAPPGGGAATAPALPPGWQITDSPAGPRLVWTAPGRVPMGDAAVEFWSGDRLLGRPVPAKDHRSFALDAGAVDAAGLAALEVRAAGRRLDAPQRAGQRRAAQPPAAAPAPLPVNPVDPGTPGIFRTVTGEYTLPGVKLPGFDQKVEMQGVVVAPKGAPGRRPLALFLHGRHYTCFVGADEDKITGDWPCAPGAKPVPSHRGYLQAQRLLASQGYVTVSISANGINGQDYQAEDGGAQARSSLVRLHLAKWADWAGAGRDDAPAAVKAVARPDLGKVLLVGHSRGGEGVNRAALDSITPPPGAQDGYRGRVRWTVRGTLLIGPTIFGHNPAPDVPSATVLPGCDGDVSDLQGQMYVDATRGVSRGAALHSAVFMVGANHNFFNTEWTPGQSVAPSSDDFWTDPEQPDPVCSPGTATRLTPAQQQTAGATYIAAAAKVFVDRDDRVRPLLDGSGVRAASAGRARVLTHAIGGERSTLVAPERTTKVTGARLCRQVTVDDPDACLSPEAPGSSPHFTRFGWFAPEDGRYAVAMNWSAPGTAAVVRPARAASVDRAKALALRVVVPPNSTGTRFDVAVTDDRGRTATLGQARLDGLPSGPGSAALWAQEVRVPLTRAAAEGVDLRRITALHLVPRSSSGEAWLVDAYGWRPGLPAPRPVALPRVDIGQLTVDEGDSGVRTYRVPVKLTGRGNGQVRLFLTDPVTSAVTQRVATVRPGDRSIDVPIRVRGNTRYGGNVTYDVSAKAVRGTMVGDYLGGALVREDDPAPTVTVTPAAAAVTEGGKLTWRFTLSAPADVDIWGYLQPLAPASGPELSTADVDRAWLEGELGEVPDPAVPISATGMSLYVVVPAGKLTADVSVPTVVDTVTEPAERLRVQQMTWPDGAEEPVPGPEFTGTVTDRP